MVMIYSDQTAYEDDADILNTGRKDLTALEDAYQIQRRKDRGDTWEQIANTRGMASLTCQMRVKLLNLAPDIKEKIDPVIRQGRRSDFPINVAQTLGTLYGIEEASYEEYCERLGVNPEVNESEGKDRFSFAVQRAVLEHISASEMKSTLAIEYIKNGRRKKNDRKNVVEKRSAKKKLKTLMSVITTPLRSVTSVWTRADVRTAFTGESASQMENKVKQIQESISELERLYELLADVKAAKEASEASKPPTKFTPSETKSLVQDNPELAAKIAASYGTTISEGKPE